MYVYICLYIYIYIYIYMYVCVCICVYMYIYQGNIYAWYVVVMLGHMSRCMDCQIPNVVITDVG